MNDKEPKCGKRLSPGDAGWLSLGSYGIDPRNLSPESAEQWKSIVERSKRLMYTGSELGLSDVTQSLIESQAAIVAGAMREEAVSNSKLHEFEGRRRQQEGSKERFKGSLRSWLRNCRR